MLISPISPTFSICSQIESTDIAEIIDQGFRSIVCNRPDHETSDQPTFDEIKATATSCGLEVAFIPVTLGNITSVDVEQFKVVIEELPKPILGFCRTGNRTQKLWSLSQVD